MINVPHIHTHTHTQQSSMDKTNSFRCVKYSLIAANTAVMIIGLVTFIVGLVSHYVVGITGSQVALVSCIAVVIGAAGFIGALREHFILLLAYIFCLILVFVFRIFYWAITPLHQGERFLMDVTVSVTLLTSLATLFLIIFAFLEAFTIQNSLPFTRQKFTQLREKWRARARDKKAKKAKAKQQTKARMKLPAPDSSIYATSTSLYGSHRRRSPGGSGRMNGTATYGSYGGHYGGHYGGSHHPSHQHHNNNSSSRARKYMVPSGVEYTPSPNTSQSSGPNNNNNNNNNVSFNTKSSSPTVEAIDFTKAKNTKPNYYHFQSPSPTTPPTAREQQQQQQQQQRWAPSTMSAAKAQTLPVARNLDSSMSNYTLNSSRHSSSSPQVTTTTTTINSSLSNLYSRYNASASSSNYLNYRATSPTNQPPPPPPASTSSQVRTSSMFTSGYPRSTTSWTNNVTTTSYVTSPAPIMSTSATRQFASVKNTKPPSSNLFTVPTSTPSNLFNYTPYSSFGASNVDQKANTKATSNLTQTRNLFSTYTAPLDKTPVSGGVPVASTSQNYARTKSPTPLSREQLKNQQAIARSNFFMSKATLPSTAASMTISPSTYVASGLTVKPVQLTRTFYTARNETQAASPVGSSNYLQLDLPKSPVPPPTSPVPPPVSYSRLMVTSAPRAQPTSIDPTVTSRKFAQLLPKQSYEEVVRSYRYPSDHSSRVRSTTLLSSSSPSVNDPRIDFPTSPTNRRVTTTERRQTTERQQHSIYYREEIHEA